MEAIQLAINNLQDKIKQVQDSMIGVTDDSRTKYLAGLIEGFHHSKKLLEEIKSGMPKMMTELFQAGSRAGYNSRSKMTGAPGDPEIENIDQWHKRMFGTEYINHMYDEPETE